MANFVGSNLLNDFIPGTNVNDIIAGQAGNDVLLGLLGNDTLKGGTGNDTLNGGLGTDTADYSNGLIDPSGPVGPIFTIGATAGVIVNLNLGVQNTGGAGIDTLVSIENVNGTSFNDTLIGNAGANVLNGQNGNDSLFGLAGNDTLNGGLGNDLLNGGLGNDFINGGAGIDTASYIGAGPVTVNLNLGVQNTGGAGIDNLVLGTIENLTGSSFNDTLIGNAGANVLTGGAGRDLLTGGAGNDTFDYNAASDSPVGAARDLIFGFSGNGAAAGDRIDLSTIDANAVLFGNQAFAAAQLTYVGGVLTANVIGGPDLQIQLVAAPLLVISDIIL